MPQVTLSVPTKKLPIFNDILSALGIENVEGKNFLPRTTYKSNSSASKDLSNSLFNKHFSWEYFSNELEFE